MYYYIYVLRTENGSLYTGIARNLFRRLSQHSQRKKSAAKYTKSHRIVSLEALWSTWDKSLAARLEYRIKCLKKAEKEALICAPQTFSQCFPGLDREDFVYHPKACLALYLKEITLKHLP